MTKPKGKTPSLLSKTNGQPENFVCKKKTSCSRCKSIICKDEQGFRIPTLQSGFIHKRAFCLICFGSILEQTQKELTILKDAWKEFQ